MGSVEGLVRGEGYDVPMPRLLRDEYATRLRRIAPVLVAVSLLPVMAGASRGLFLWDVIPTVGLAEALRLLSPLFLAAGMAATSAVGRLSRFGLAVLVLGQVVLAVGAFTASPLGYRELFDSTMAFVGRNPLPILLGLALLAAGSQLWFGEGTQRVARRLTGAGVVLLLAFYALPQLGEPYAVGVVRGIVRVSLDAPWPVLMASLVWWILWLTPLGLALAGAWTLRPAGVGMPLLPYMARHAVPGLVLMMSYPAMVRGFDSTMLLLQVKAAVLMAVVITLVSRAVEAAARDLVEDVAEPPPPEVRWLKASPGRLRKVAAAVAGGALVLLGVRIYHPGPDLEWEMREPSETETLLVTEILPELVVRLSMRNSELFEGGGGGEAAVMLRSQVEEATRAAGRIDEELEARVRGLVGLTGEIEMSGLRWRAATVAVNQRLRKLGLPFFLDASALEYDVDGAARRLFFITSHRVERIERVSTRVGGLGVLHLRRIDDLNIAGSTLGRVVQDEPFGLVELTEIEGHAATIAAAIAGDGMCLSPGLLLEYGMDAFGPWAALASCGRIVAGLVPSGEDGAPVEAALEAAFDVALTASTQRHELQHLLDGDDLAVPSEAAMLLPNAPDRVLRSLAAELSAYLCELDTEDPVSAALSLADMLSFLSRPSRYGASVERLVAGLYLSRLAGSEVMDRGGVVDWGKVSAVLDGLEKLEADALAGTLSSAARSAHEHWFDTGCEPL